MGGVGAQPLAQALLAAQLHLNVEKHFGLGRPHRLQQQLLLLLFLLLLLLLLLWRPARTSDGRRRVESGALVAPTAVAGVAAAAAAAVVVVVVAVVVVIVAVAAEVTELRTALVVWNIWKQKCCSEARRLHGINSSFYLFW